MSHQLCNTVSGGNEFIRILYLCYFMSDLKDEYTDGIMNSEIIGLSIATITYCYLQLLPFTFKYYKKRRSTIHCKFHFGNMSTFFLNVKQ